MKHLILAFGCLLLGSCMNISKKETKTTTESCHNDRSSMEVVMDLHRKVKPEHIGSFKTAFAECKAATVQEPGCVDYGVYQSPEDSTKFLIYEVWKSEGELAKHGETEHLKKFLEQTKGMIESESNKKIYVCTEAQK